MTDSHTEVVHDRAGRSSPSRAVRRGVERGGDVSGSRRAHLQAREEVGPAVGGAGPGGGSAEGRSRAEEVHGAEKRLITPHSPSARTRTPLANPPASRRGTRRTGSRCGCRPGTGGRRRGGPRILLRPSG